MSNISTEKASSNRWVPATAALFRTCDHLTPYKAKKPLAECKRSGHCKRGEPRALPKKLKIVTTPLSALSNDFGIALSPLGAKPADIQQSPNTSVCVRIGGPKSC